MGKKQNFDFRYVEFIRKPQMKAVSGKLNGGKPDVKNIICVALDYFDVIYVKKVDDLRACMISENDIPCEAYQSLGLFRKEEEKNEREVENDPFQVDQEYPFFALMQVTVTPEAYQQAEEGKEFDTDVLEKELNKTVFEAQQFFAAGNQVDGFKLKHRIYHTCTDVCVGKLCG